MKKTTQTRPNHAQHQSNNPHPKRKGGHPRIIDVRQRRADLEVGRVLVFDSASCACGELGAIDARRPDFFDASASSQSLFRSLLSWEALSPGLGRPARRGDRARCPWGPRASTLRPHWLGWPGMLAGRCWSGLYPTAETIRTIWVALGVRRRRGVYAEIRERGGWR